MEICANNKTHTYNFIHLLLFTSFIQETKRISYKARSARLAAMSITGLTLPQQGKARGRQSILLWLQEGNIKFALTLSYRKFRRKRQFKYTSSHLFLHFIKVWFPLHLEQRDVCIAV